MIGSKNCDVNWYLSSFVRRMTVGSEHSAHISQKSNRVIRIMEQLLVFLFSTGEVKKPKHENNRMKLWRVLRNQSEKVYALRTVSPKHHTHITRRSCRWSCRSLCLFSLIYFLLHFLAQSFVFNVSVIVLRFSIEAFAHFNSALHSSLSLIFLFSQYCLFACLDLGVLSQYRRIDSTRFDVHSAHTHTHAVLGMCKCSSLYACYCCLSNSMSVCKFRMFLRFAWKYVANPHPATDFSFSLLRCTDQRIIVHVFLDMNAFCFCAKQVDSSMDFFFFW